MNVETIRHGNIVTVKLVGRVDHTNADHLGEELNDASRGCSAGGDKLILDLSSLQYISSAGLRVFMVVSKKTRPNGGQVVFAAPNELVREILEISRFDMVFPLHDSVLTALVALGEADS